jgi:hypothetical protein
MGTEPSEGSWDGHRDAVAQMATEPVQPTEALKMPSATSAFPVATQFDGSVSAALVYVLPRA